MFARAVHFISKSTCFLVAVPSHRCRSNLRRSGLFHWQCSRPETARTHQTALVLIPLAVLPPRNLGRTRTALSYSTGSVVAPKTLGRTRTAPALIPVAVQRDWFAIAAAAAASRDQLSTVSQLLLANRCFPDACDTMGQSYE